jgi:pimeloyl-ACP methyl ester carboxylesterase
MGSTPRSSTCVAGWPTGSAWIFRVADVLAVADTCDTGSFHYLAVSLGANIGWGLAASAQDCLDSITLIGAEPEANEEVSEEFADLLRQGPPALAEAMSQMWEMPEWALDQQRRIDPEAQFATFQAWPDLSPVPAELRVPLAQTISRSCRWTGRTTWPASSVRRRARHT